MDADSNQAPSDAGTHDQDNASMRTDVLQHNDDELESMTYARSHQFHRPNLVLGPGENELVPSVIEDMGFSTTVGRAIRDGIEGTDASAYLNTSVASRTFRVRGVFMGDFHFEDFPNDHQTLDVKISLPSTLPVRKTRLIARADNKPREGGGELPLWTTTCVRASSGINDYQELVSTVIANPDDPFAKYWRWVFAQSAEVQQDELFSSDSEGDIGPTPQLGEAASPPPAPARSRPPRTLSACPRTRSGHPGRRSGGRSSLCPGPWSPR